MMACAKDHLLSVLQGETPCCQSVDVYCVVGMYPKYFAIRHCHTCFMCIVSAVPLQIPLINILPDDILSLGLHFPPMRFYLALVKPEAARLPGIAFVPWTLKHAQHCSAQDPPVSILHRIRMLCCGGDDSPVAADTKLSLVWLEEI